MLERAWYLGASVETEELKTPGEQHVRGRVLLMSVLFVENFVSMILFSHLKHSISQHIASSRP